MAGLFVNEDDDMHVDGGAESQESFHEAYEEQPMEGISNTNETSDEEENEDEDDPIIQSIPLVLNKLSDLSKHSLHILQYPGRPSRLPYPSVKASIKPNSAYIELKVPLDTSKFYDESKSEDWGTTVREHGLQGVLNRTGEDNQPPPLIPGGPEPPKTEPSNGGTYIAKLHEGKLIITPVDRTVQLRPTFKYLDDLELAKQAQRRTEFAETNGTTNSGQKVQVLQTSMAKPSPQGNTGDTVGSHALGESLRCIKKFEDEDWTSLEFRDADDEEAVALKEALFKAPSDILTTKVTMEEYITKLTDV
ncbi:DNA-directed RNA polymerase III subunit RPC5 [[Candida] anglica]|uniref:DNA-directed RNA polymerase III subunit RPC5 n=1 Tax=[Candida] anglica TaxID=148631 RepID=A0ABP0E929_9ASCO